jgi:hypothetical protein
MTAQISLHESEKKIILDILEHHNIPLRDTDIYGNEDIITDCKIVISSENKLRFYIQYE